jgi:uncharacterized protein YbaP (TraB family)
MLVKTTNMFLICLAITVAGMGQSGAPNGKRNGKAKAAAVDNHLDNTLLWKITGKGLTHPSYLFGTMHILCADDANLSDSLKKVIRDSKIIYFELDMDNFQELMGAMKYLRMNDGKKLSELLSKEEYERVETYFKNNKSMLPFAMMNRFKPYFISSLIGEQMMSCSQKNGMEELIMRESKQYEKEIKGLETTEFQASIFDSIPYEKQAKDLVAYIDSIDNYREVTMEMVNVYRQQNLERMDSLMHKSDPGMEQYMDLLLYGRNRRWVAQMPEIMKEQTVLFAVGAGHLPGEQGVISLLRKAGYSVTPMKNVNSVSESQ